MPILRRPVHGARASIAVAVLVVAAAVSPVAASGPQLGTPRLKTLIETDHFGTFYLPQVVTAGRSVVAMWRGPNQNGTVRTFAISKNGGETFTYKLKPIRIPVMAQLMAVAGDDAGNLYFAGTTTFANQIAVVRTDTKLKAFSAGTLIDDVQNIVGIDLAVASNGALYLAYQTTYAVRVNNIQTFTSQLHWAASADRGDTFAEFAVTNARPTQLSDATPSLSTGADGSVWLFNVRDDTAARAAEPDTYTGGQVLATRIDVPESEPVVLARAGEDAGQPSTVRGFVAADGSLGVAWAERTPGAAPVQSVFFTLVAPGTAPAPPEAPLARVGTPAIFHLGRTDDGQVVVLLHGAGLDSTEREPAIIGRASNDDGRTFGPIRQVTGYPSVTSLNLTPDGRRLYGLWTDTRMVRFCGFVAKP